MTTTVFCSVTVDSPLAPVAVAAESPLLSQELDETTVVDLIVAEPEPEPEPDSEPDGEAEPDGKQNLNLERNQQLQSRTFKSSTFSIFNRSNKIINLISFNNWSFTH